MLPEPTPPSKMVAETCRDDQLCIELALGICRNGSPSYGVIRAGPIQHPTLVGPGIESITLLAHGRSNRFCPVLLRQGGWDRFQTAGRLVETEGGARGRKNRTPAGRRIDMQKL